MQNSQAKLMLLASCLALVVAQKSSNALLLGNFIGCNSFGCRLSALESDVAQLKQQVARFAGPQGMQSLQGMNNLRPNNMLPFNQNGINQNQQNLQNLQNQQQQGNQSPAMQTDGGQRVNYALDYPAMSSQNLHRSSSYPGSINNGQFLRA